MRKYAIGAITLALVVTLFTGCGCTNSKPMNTEASTLPPTTGATIMPTVAPTTEATTKPTTEATTIPTTADTEMPSETGDMATENSGATEMPGESGAADNSRSRMPAHSGK